MAAAPVAGRAATSPSRATKKACRLPACGEIPDVAFDADPNTGVAVYDSYDYGNTDSPGAGRRHKPCFALLGRSGRHRQPAPRLPGLGTLDGPSQTLPTLYAIDGGRFPRHHQRQQRRLLGRAGLRHGHRPGQSAGQPVRARLALYPTGAVTNPATTVSLTVSSNPVQYSQPVTFAVTVADSDVGRRPARRHGHVPGREHGNRHGNSRPRHGLVHRFFARLWAATRSRRSIQAMGPSRGNTSSLVSRSRHPDYDDHVR